MAKATLSSMLESVHGKLGEFALVQLKSGPVVRQRPRYKRPVSPAQRQGIDRLKEATELWNTFTAAQAQAWNAYAATLTKTSPQTGESYSPIGFNAFTALATKFRQMHPSSPLPTSPPVDPFVPDGATVSVQAGPGKVRFTAGVPNSAGTTTELLVQRLANPRRKPSGAYKSMGFHAFAPGAMQADVPLEPGVYACAYRFAESATGRTSVLITLGIVLV